MRAAILARVSRGEQAGEDRLSLPAQLRVMRERCGREGWEVVREFVAPGERAATAILSRRPVLSEVLRAAEAGEFDVLVVHELGRFARDEELGNHVMNRLGARGIRLVNATSEIDYRTSEGRMFFNFELGAQSYWSRKMGEHIGKAKRERFEMGLHLGDVPFGYRKVGPKAPVEVVPEEAAAIAEGFRDYVSGKSWTEIMREWNGAGLRPRSKRGHGEFTIPAMQSIFENDFYAGFVRHHGERKVGLHEAIVSEELWLKAQARVKRRTSRSVTPRLLSGIATCMRCGGPIWVTSSGKAGHPVYYYREPSKERGASCVDAQGRVRLEVADGLVERIVLSMTTDERWLRETERLARTMPVVDRSAERVSLMEEKKRATTAYVAGALEEVEWRRRVGAIDDRLSRLPAPLPGGVVFTGERLREVGQVWGVMKVEERREACRLLFEEIAVDVKARDVRVRPWPEFEPWFEARRELVGRLVGSPGIGASKHPTPWLYGVEQLERPA